MSFLFSFDNSHIIIRYFCSGLVPTRNICGGFGFIHLTPYVGLVEGIFEECYLIETKCRESLNSIR